ncbi:Protein of unknown function [Micromonospora lupini str. Lupac 08]|uniref:Uncharacterized protein n=1 Tax=Micromonospora lupini str. Lupac 08 TaxID=1150864 RepID=I0L6X7_9ACTN|nr:Protein of unknown function [Micromonospora lupini str. Lupac 08]
MALGRPMTSSKNLELDSSVQL